MNISNKYAIKSKAIIYQNELDYISQCVLDYPNIETGGDLFGFWTYSGFPVIQYVIGPGKNSNHQVAFFNQDLEYLKEVGDALRETHGLQHIGEWHSHHRLGLAEPSGHDISTVTNAIDNYSLGKFFLVITNVREESTGINGFMFKKEQGRTFDYTGWVILKGESPIRTFFDSENASLVYKPKTSNSSIIGLSEVQLNETNYVKPEYVSEYWLNNKSNHLILKNIIEGLNNDFEDVKVFQNDSDKSIYLQFKHIEKKIALLFPSDFPQSKPKLLEILTNENLMLNTDIKEWNSENEIVNETISFTKSILEIKPKSLINKILNK